MDETGQSELPSTRPTTGVGGNAVEALADEARTLDRYLLIERAGRGSFGTVWAAYDPQLDRKVAIKVLHLRKQGQAPGREDEHQRLLREAQMLGQLSHPNVVTIHDVRPLDDQPESRGLFIVMEYLAGPTLATWMREATRTWIEVLDVFGQAGRGLAAAHERGLVHRDFKPANAMFGADQRLRVLDFGLAGPGETVDPERANPPESQSRPRVVGTLAYMAPEQHAGIPSDARSDQFSFCAALYEALHGRKPFEGSGAAIGRAKVRGQVLPPPRGSKVPVRLQRVLERGLAPEPDARFADMASLLAELERDPALERRRWLLFGVFSLAVGGSGYGLAQLREPPELPSCEPPGDAFAGVWDESIRIDVRQAFAADSDSANAELARVESGLDDWARGWAGAYADGCETERASDPSAKFDTDDPVRMCLERGLRRARGLTSLLRSADETTHAHAIEGVAALEQSSSCLERRVPVVGTPASVPDTTEIESDLARAQALLSVARFAEADVLALECVERAAALGDPLIEARARLVSVQATRSNQGAAKAVTISEQAVTAAMLADDPDTIIGALIQHLGVHDELGHADAAATVAQLADAYAAGAGLGRASQTDLDLACGRMLFRADRFADARTRLERARVGASELYGEQHPKLATIHTLLGIVASHESGRPVDSVGHFERALSIRRVAFGEHHPLTAEALGNRASGLVQLGRYDDAKLDFEQVKAVFAAVHGLDSGRMMIVELDLGFVELARGRLVDSLAHYERAAELGERHYGPTHSWMTDIYPQRGLLQVRLGNFPAAIADFRRNLAAHEAADGADTAKTAVGKALLAAALREAAAADLLGTARQGLIDEANGLDRLVRTKLEVELPQDIPVQSIALAELVRIAIQDERLDEALELADRLVAHERTTAVGGPAGLAAAATWRARALLALDRNREARDSLIAAANTEGIDALGLIDLRELVAEAELRLGDRESARNQLGLALALASTEQSSPIDRQRIETKLAALGDSP